MYQHSFANEELGAKYWTQMHLIGTRSQNRKAQNPKRLTEKKREKPTASTQEMDFDQIDFSEGEGDEERERDAPTMGRWRNGCQENQARQEPQRKRVASQIDKKTEGDSLAG